MEQLVLHGVRSLRYDFSERVYKVKHNTETPVIISTKVIDIDGFIDKIEPFDSGHFTVTFSIPTEDD